VVVVVLGQGRRRWSRFERAQRAAAARSSARCKEQASPLSLSHSHTHANERRASSPSRVVVFSSHSRARAHTQTQQALAFERGRGGRGSLLLLRTNARERGPPLSLSPDRTPPPQGPRADPDATESHTESARTAMVRVGRLGLSGALSLPLSPFASKNRHAATPPHAPHPHPTTPTTTTTQDIRAFFKADVSPLLATFFAPFAVAAAALHSIAQSSRPPPLHHHPTTTTPTTAQGHGQEPLQGCRRRRR
jgi:hypothetical protein